MKGQRLILYGCGGVGRAVRYFVERLCYVPIGFLDDSRSVWGTRVEGLPVLGDLSAMRGIDNDVRCALSLALPGAKRQLAYDIDEVGRSWVNVVHPRAWIAQGVEVGEGAILYPGVSANVGSKIGRHCTINMNVALGHDVQVEDFATISPGVALGGHTRVGEGAFIGIGASVIQGIQIGAWSVVGAGAVVIEDVEPNTVVAGVPARVINRRPEGWQHG